VRIALVNDTSLALQALRRVLALEPRLQIAWEARDGVEAVQRAERDRPDLILMDLLMPNLDGVEATRRIMAATPCPILVVTGSVNSRAGLVYEALGHGAIDAIRMPSLVEPAAQAGAALLRRIRQIERLTRPPTAERAAVGAGATSGERRALPPLIAIGSSTGGPAALVACLAPLPAELTAAVLIAQHIEAQFAPGLAHWLDGQIRLPVRPVCEGDPVRAGVVHLAASNDHLVLRGDGRLGYSAEPRQEPYRPSVNRLFHSLLHPAVRPGQAVLLTGMGRDGAAGLLELRKAGWHTYAQTQDSCAVYGMPKAAMDLQAACEQLDPATIGASLRRSAADGTAGRR
jgi:two-component system response regulator WspF